MNKSSVKTALGFTILSIILIISVFASLFLGAEKISPVSVFGNSELVDSFEQIIVFDLRLPRILLCILCGALLGGSGAVFQGFFRNPLADSGILGISSGATLGAILSIFLSASTLWSFKFLSPISVFAFIGGIASGVLIFVFSLSVKGNSSVTLLLAGTAIGTFLSAVSSFLLLWRQKDLHLIYSWTMGSFNAKGWDEFFVYLIPSLLALILLTFCSKSLDILGNGEKTAVSLGLNLRFTKIFVLTVGSLATSCAVCEGGIISFVGLISPHCMRSLFGSEHKTLIPFSMIFGSILILISDTFARIILAPAEIPVGIITSIIGVPFFIIVLKKNAGSANV